MLATNPGRYISRIRVFVEAAEVSRLPYLLCYFVVIAFVLLAAPLQGADCSSANKKTSGIPATTCTALSDVMRYALITLRRVLLCSFSSLSVFALASSPDDWHRVQCPGLPYRLRLFCYLVLEALRMIFGSTDRLASSYLLYILRVL